MKDYLVFGFHSEDLESTREAVERVLSLRLVKHESSYRGGDYFRCGDAGD